jgi:hypothetical protein
MILRSGNEASAGAALPTHGQRSKFQPMAPTDDLQQSNSQHLPSPPDQPMDVQMLQQDSPGTPARWIKPLQVDASSRPLLEGPVKPGTFNSFIYSGSSINDLLVACFYILYREPQHSTTKEYYQAVYIMKREAKELIASIAAKCNFDPTSILQMVNVTQTALSINVDDDVVHELPESQDMVLDLSRITAHPARREWDKVADANFIS